MWNRALEKHLTSLDFSASGGSQDFVHLHFFMSLDFLNLPINIYQKQSETK